MLAIQKSWAVSHCSFRLTLLSHAGPVDVILLHAPKVLQILLLPGAAFTERFGSCSTDWIFVTGLRAAGRGNCRNSESDRKCSEAFPGRHGGFPFCSARSTPT